MRLAAPHEGPILDNLLQLYAHDFSEFHDVELGPDGRFNYHQLPLYWEDPSRHPFLIAVDGKLAGFVFVKRLPPWDMAEFFILRAYRRRKIGTEIAHQVWRRFPGPWQVRVMQANKSALRFWEQAVATFAPGPIHSLTTEKDGESWRVLTFTAAAEPRYRT